MSKSNYDLMFKDALSLYSRKKPSYKPSTRQAKSRKKDQNKVSKPGTKLCDNYGYQTNNEYLNCKRLSKTYYDGFQKRSFSPNNRSGSPTLIYRRTVITPEAQNMISEKLSKLLQSGNLLNGIIVFSFIRIGSWIL